MFVGYKFCAAYIPYTLVAPAAANAGTVPIHPTICAWVGATPFAAVKPATNWLTGLK